MWSVSEGTENGTYTSLGKNWEAIENLSWIWKEELAKSNGIGVGIWEIRLYKEAAVCEGP